MDSYTIREPVGLLAYTNVANYAPYPAMRHVPPKKRPWYEDLEATERDLWERIYRPKLELLRIEVTRR